MSMRQTFSLAAAAASLALTGVASAETVIDFESLNHGDIVNGQIAGININAINNGGGPDLAVVFDSTRTQTNDSDLEDAWDAGNIPSQTVLGNLLIIQEHGPDRAGNVDPDDEGSRPAGYFTFHFDQAISSFGFDLIDVEAQGEFTAAYFASFHENGSLLAKVNFSDLITRDSSIVFGNNSANRITPFTLAELGIGAFDEVHIGMGGSGAIDNLRYQVVPTPAAAGVGLMLLTGLAARRRRRA